jgi:hypothetical protein
MQQCLVWVRYKESDNLSNSLGRTPVATEQLVLPEASIPRVNCIDYGVCTKLSG